MRLRLWTGRCASMKSGEYELNDVSTGYGDTNIFLNMLRAGRLDVASLLNREYTASAAVAMFNDRSESGVLGAVIRW